MWKRKYTEEIDSLRELVFALAENSESGDVSVGTVWLEELRAQGIGNLDTLEKAVFEIGDSWEETLGKLSEGLREALAIWDESGSLRTSELRAKTRKRKKAKKAEGSLRDLVLGWAEDSGDVSQGDLWLEELQDQGIWNVVTLMERARTLRNLSEGLEEARRTWYEELLEFGGRIRRKLQEESSDCIEGTLYVDETNPELMRYRDIGARLVNDKVVQGIIGILNKLPIADIESDRIPFVLISNSSGTGKTQLAFAIEAAVKDPQNFFYLVSVYDEYGCQFIYDAFKGPTQLFIECIVRDCRIIREEGLHYKDPFSVSSIRWIKLYTFGFIGELLSKGYTYQSKVQIRRTYYKEIIEKLKGKSPIVFIDEFRVRNLRIDKVKLKILRNIFRAVNIRLILSGTNSSAVELTPDFPISNIRTDLSSDYVWCYFFTKLPQVLTSTLPLSLGSPLLAALVSNSRPLFGVFVEDELKSMPVYSNSELDNILTSVSCKIFCYKDIFREQYGRYGQVCLFLNSCYVNICLKPLNNDSLHTYNKENSIPLVNEHLAKLVSEAEPLEISAFLRKPNGERFLTESEFPPIHEDILLYFVLMGGKNWYPFKDRYGRRISYWEAIGDLLRCRQENSVHIRFTNNRYVRNEMVYEATLACVVCAVSHYGGIGGIPFPNFLEEIIREISGDVFFNLDFESCFQGKLSFLKEFRVPFLSPPNIPWPQWLYGIVEDIHLGNLQKPQGNQLDLYTDCGITGECKYELPSLITDTMYEILLRIPTDSVAHFVLTDFPQKISFRETLSKAVTANPILNSCIFRRVDVKNGVTKVRGMSNCKNPKCAVFFVLRKRDSLWHE